MSEDTVVGCPFCEAGASATAFSELAFARRDSFPVNPGHTLIIPRRHVASWFDATPDEQVAMLRLLNEVKAALDRELQPALGSTSVRPEGRRSCTSTCT
jgi:diadenosine tetraphosphate (Ap4A) HIT family hydrolase